MQPQYCGCFTHAGGMYPDQWTLRPGRAGNAAALAKADRVFLAALAPLREYNIAIGASGRVKALSSRGSIDRPQCGARLDGVGGSRQR